MSATESTSLELSLTPGGDLRLAAELNGTVPLAPKRASAICAAFARGRGHGLFHLGAVEVGTRLPPSLAYWRDVGHLFVTRLCALPDLDERRADFDLPAPAEDLRELALTCPPMVGAEYLRARTLEALWRDIAAACRVELEEHDGSADEFLHARNPVWNLVGRVHFHLAEQKNDERRPFAFLATYTTRVGAGGSLKHLPLGKAVSDASADGATDRRALLKLLRPVQAAAQRSTLLAEIVASKQIYHPLAWSSREALRFLRDVPLYEESGVVVTVPDWWKSRSSRRPIVQVSLGAAAPSTVGLSALLDFSVDLVLDGERLTRKEVAAILAETDGLAMIRGRWVEVDGEKLRQVLAHWEAVEEASKDGISFAEGLRFLAGVDAVSGGALAEAPSDDLAAWSERVAGPWLRETLAELRAGGRTVSADLDGKLAATLRPYQQRGVDWLWTLYRLGLGGCLADDMGLGKTIQVIALLLLLERARPDATTLVVAPASLVANWTAELSRFAPGLDVYVAHPSVTPREELLELDAERLCSHDVVITTYGYLGRLAVLTEFQWDLTIIDEAQAIKNPSAQQTRAVKRLASGGRFALTGTPIENRLGDLWSLFDFVNRGLLGTAKEFTRYTRTLEKRESNPYAPLRALITPYILRRLKTDPAVVSDLPDKTEVDCYCSLSKVQAVLYQDSVRELTKALERLDGDEGMRRRGVVLSFLTRFKQICNHPSQWLSDGDWAPSKSGKFTRLRELCETIAARQEKVLVFTQYRAMTRPLAEFLGTVFRRPGVTLDGSIAVGKRRKLVESFQTDEAVPFFVISLRAGGTGLNLTAASHVIHFDRWWNPAVESQATDRAYRIGQMKNVVVHRFVCLGTVEERVGELIRSKQQLSRDLLEGAGDTVLTELGDEELLELVSLDLRQSLGDTAPR